MSSPQSLDAIDIRKKGAVACTFVFFYKAYRCLVLSLIYLISQETKHYCYFLYTLLHHLLQRTTFYQLKSLSSMLILLAPGSNIKYNHEFRNKFICFFSKNKHRFFRISLIQWISLFMTTYMLFNICYSFILFYLKQQTNGWF